MYPMYFSFLKQNMVLQVLLGAADLKSGHNSWDENNLSMVRRPGW